MSRFKLWHLLTALAGVTGVVAFFLGYLSSSDDVPEILDPPAGSAPVLVVSGVITAVDGDIIQMLASDERSFTLSTNNISSFAITTPGGWDDIEEGDTLIVAIETDQLGGRALRAAVVVEADDAAAP